MEIGSNERPFAVVTGASRGIGAEYARALAAKGYDLLLASRSGPLLDRLAADLGAQYGVQVSWEVLDLAEPDAAHRLFASACRLRSHTDLLVNNAGFGLYGHFTEMPMARLEEMIRLHVNTVVASMRLFLPPMIERRLGAIINVASVAGLLPVPYLAQYGATKAFLVSLSEAVAQEVGGFGVRVQACCPSSTETEFHAAAGYAPKDPIRSDSPAEVVAASLAALDAGRVVATVGLRGRMLRWLTCVIPRGMLLRRIAAFMKPGAR